MACQTLNANILGVCDYENVTGVETDAVIINKLDIDYSATTVTDNVITVLQLKSGKTGYSLKGVKVTNTVVLENVANPSGSDRTKQTFNAIVSLTSDNALALDKVKGSSDGFVVVYKAKTKESGDIEAFRVLGFRQGLFGSVTHNSSENGGGASIALASLDGYEEPRTLLFLQSTDYATTQALFDAKFIEP